jgi:hypothetical protein
LTTEKRTLTNTLEISQVRGRKTWLDFLNHVLLIITQGYNFTKQQSFSEQNNFASKLAISANQTFGYIIDLRIANKAQKFEYLKKKKNLPYLHWNIQFSGLNSRIYASLIPFLLSFPNFLGHIMHFSKSTRAN